MSFRPATLEDAELLYQWRQADEQADFYQGSTGFDEHRQWLMQRIDNPLVQLLIWEHRRMPAGMVRIDSNGEIAFHVKTEPVEMLCQATKIYASRYGGRLKATLDEADDKAEVLGAAGFRAYPAISLIFLP